MAQLEKEVLKHLDRTIKKTWLEGVFDDYIDSHMLHEDSLKCAFYYHLRTALGDGWLRRHKLRIYAEYRLPSGRRADIALVRLLPANERRGNHLSDDIETIVAIIEFKFKNCLSPDPFRNDIKKLREYAREYPDCQLYAAFIHEDIHGDGFSWFTAKQTANWAKGRVSELIGYWDDDDQYVEKVNSYNRMNTDLDAQ